MPLSAAKRGKTLTRQKTTPISIETDDGLALLMLAVAKGLRHQSSLIGEKSSTAIAHDSSADNLSAPIESKQNVTPSATAVKLLRKAAWLEKRAAFLSSEPDLAEKSMRARIKDFSIPAFYLFKHKELLPYVLPSLPRSWATLPDTTAPISAHDDDILLENLNDIAVFRWEVIIEGECDAFPRHREEFFFDLLLYNALPKPAHRPKNSEIRDSTGHAADTAWYIIESNPGTTNQDAIEEALANFTRVQQRSDGHVKSNEIVAISPEEARRKVRDLLREKIKDDDPRQRKPD